MTWPLAKRIPEASKQSAGKVDLPEPLGPMMETNSPVVTCMFTPRTA